MKVKALCLRPTGQYYSVKMSPDRDNPALLENRRLGWHVTTSNKPVFFDTRPILCNTVQDLGAANPGRVADYRKPLLLTEDKALFAIGCAPYDNGAERMKERREIYGISFARKRAELSKGSNPGSMATIMAFGMLGISTVALAVVALVYAV